MKKIGFIAIAIITVLATLGIGFSMWSQTVTVNGTVGTGNVTLTVGGYTGTWAYKNADSQLVWYSGGGSAAAVPTVPASALWSGAYAEVLTVNGNSPTGPVSCTSQAGLTVALKYQNLFPAPDANGTFRPWTADFDVTNNGSIPVKLEVSPISTTDANGAGMPNITISYLLGGVTSVTGEALQLEPGNFVHVAVSLAVGENTVQSYNGTFSLAISGVQWNEYTSGAGGGGSIVPRSDLGFESGTGDWAAYQAINRVPFGGGTLKLPADQGSDYAELQNSDYAYGYGFGMGGYSYYGGKGNTYQGNFYQAIDVYVDVTWAQVNPAYAGFWIDMTPYHADSNNYGAEHNFNLWANGGSVTVTADDTTTLGNITTSGWYTFVMTWSKAANPSDPAISNLMVYRAGTLTQVGTTATLLATSPGGPLASSDLLGTGYVWITVWQNGFAGDVLGIDNLAKGILPYTP